MLTKKVRSRLHWLVYKQAGMKLQIVKVKNEAVSCRSLGTMTVRYHASSLVSSGLEDASGGIVILGERQQALSCAGE